MKREAELRKEIVRICKKLALGKFIAATDGNVSCRCDSKRFLITPSGRPKGDLTPDDIIKVDDKGNICEGYGRCSSETKMHLLIYNTRKDVKAIVHAHPPLLTAFTLAGIPFPSKVLPEVWITVGPVATAPYATPSTEEVVESISSFVMDHNAILLERHGSVTMGNNLEEAYMRLEKMEHAAHTLFYAYILKGSLPEPLDWDSIERLEAAFRQR